MSNSLDGNYDDTAVDELNADQFLNFENEEEPRSTDFESVKPQKKKIFKTPKQKLQHELEELKLYQSCYSEVISYDNLLRQALITNDGKLLDNVIQTDKVNVIRRTILDLQPQYIEGLILELIIRLQKSPLRAKEIGLWFREILSSHTSFCLSVPTIIKHLETLSIYIQTRLKFTNRLVKMQTILDNISALALARLEFSKEYGDDNDAEAPLIFNNIEDHVPEEKLDDAVMEEQQIDKNDSDVCDNDSLTDSFDEFMDNAKIDIK